jgi:hypothetical protein
MTDKMTQDSTRIIDSNISIGEKARQLKSSAPFYFTNAMIGKLIGRANSDVSRYLSQGQYD